MIPKELAQIESFLKHSAARFPTGSGDSRRDSGEAEKSVISLLQNQKWDFSVHSPNIGQSHNRAWHDVKIAEYYCDIKISALRAADNTNAKNAIFFFLTGLDPIKERISMAEESFFKKMKEKESPDNKRDYFYIVINKNDPSDAFVLSLKGLKNLQISPNNLPFQCHWDHNRKLEKRTWKKAKEFLLEHWAKGIKKKIENAERGMPQHYPEYFK